MKPELIFRRRFVLTCRSGKVILVYMDVFKLPDSSSKMVSEGYRFSWIAYDSENEAARVLFDNHPPKGPHSHIDGDLEGKPFKWKSLDASYERFFEKVRDRFGDFEITEEK